MLMKCHSVVFHWLTTYYYSLKYQYAEANAQNQCVWKETKAQLWEPTLPNENATDWQRKGEIGALALRGSAGGKPPSSKIATKISVDRLITTRILLLVIFIMALKGSELYFPPFKVSVTQSYYYIYYKIYHHRNTIYQSQISAWTNLGFRLLVL